MSDCKHEKLKCMDCMRPVSAADKIKAASEVYDPTGMTWKERAEVEILEREKEWNEMYEALRRDYEERTRAIRKQLDVVMALVAQSELLKPPVVVMTKRTDNLPLPEGYPNHESS